MGFLSYFVNFPLVSFTLWFYSFDGQNAFFFLFLKKKLLKINVLMTVHG